MNPGHAACLACGFEGERTIVALKPGARVARCSGCGLGSLLDPPTIEELDRLYRSDLYSPGPPRAERVVDLAQRLIGGLRLRTLRRPVRGRLLDVGSGKGHFLESARRAGWEVVGLEYSAAAAEEGRRRYGVETVVGDWLTTPLEGRFDVISMWHVLEHMPDPAAAVRRARQMLEPEGCLVVSVPNAASLQARMFGSAWFHLDLPRHLYHFTPQALVRLLECTGFEVVRRNTFAPEMEIMGFLASIQNRLGVEPNLALRFLKRDVTVASPASAVGSLLLAALSTPVAGLLSVAALAVGRGASIQVVARPTYAGESRQGLGERDGPAGEAGHAPRLRSAVVLTPPLA